MAAPLDSEELDELIVLGRLDEVLRRVTLDEIALAWCRNAVVSLQAIEERRRRGSASEDSGASWGPWRSGVSHRREELNAKLQWLVDRPREPDSGDSWASSFLLELRGSAIPERDELFRELVVKLVEYAPDSDVLSCIGAGPLEDYVWQSESRIVWIEVECARSPGFREAMTNVFYDEDVPEWVWDRIERATGQSVKHRPS